MRMPMLVGCILFGGLAIAQDRDLTFEVASLKPSGPKSIRNFEGGPGTRDPEQITCTKASVMDLLHRAYEIEQFQVSGPGWVFESEVKAFDFHAKVPAGTTKEQARIMMQNLLAERFHLALHHVSREFPAYELVVAKNGPKFGESAQDVSHLKEGYPELPAGRPGAWTSYAVGHARVAAREQSISSLIISIRTSAGQPIIDTTGLTGKYNYALHFDPAPLSATADPGIVSDAAPNLLIALEQQLGLKLVSKKMPFDVLVIDHIDDVPTEN